MNAGNECPPDRFRFFAERLVGDRVFTALEGFARFRGERRAEVAFMAMAFPDFHDAFAGMRCFLTINGFGPRPRPASMSAKARSEATDRSISATSCSPANSSRCLMSNQFDRCPPTAIGFHTHQDPTTLQFLPVQRKLELTLLQTQRGVLVRGFPCAAIP